MPTSMEEHLAHAREAASRAAAERAAQDPAKLERAVKVIQAALEQGLVELEDLTKKEK